MVEPLLPIRHPERDFFICDFGDVIPKSDIASMEHPLFTLSTKPDRAIRKYEHNDNSVTITPSVLGLATIHDKDVLIYCISQLMAGINQGDEPSRKVRFKARDLLVTTNRQTSGQGYKLLRQAFDRLAGTLITTDIRTNEQRIIEGFGIIDSYKVIVEDFKTERMVELEITLSEWLYNSILGQEILSIDNNYFRIRKPIERRIYEIARKHCGRQKQWHISLKNLHKKVGSSGTVRRLRAVINHIVENNHLPEYSLSSENGNVIFNYRNYKSNSIITGGIKHRPLLNPDTIDKAKRILGRNFDVYAIEYEWLEYWEIRGRTELKTPDGAFINFCKKKTEKD